MNEILPSINDNYPLILYHSNCPDGFGAAFSAWQFYKKNEKLKTEYIPLKHGEIKNINDLINLTETKTLENRTIYILDFSFSKEIIIDLIKIAEKLILLDHHKSAFDNLNELNNSDYKNSLIYFDLNKSGAKLAWEYFVSKNEIPVLINYVEDRDLWNWNFKESKGFLAALDNEEKDFEIWQKIINFSEFENQEFIKKGQAMYEKFSKLCEQIAEKAQDISLNNNLGLMVNCPSMFHSQVGNLLAQKSQTFALMWQADIEGVKVGLRSTKEEFNCIPLAQSFGGGGHPRACGFKLSYEDLPELLSGTLNSDKR